MFIFTYIFRSKIIWRCPAPDLSKKTKPLGQHREAANPVQAIVAPQRRNNELAKERKEEQIQSHEEKKPGTVKEVSSLRIESPRQHKSQSTQVCPSSRRPIRRDVGTQCEAELDVDDIEIIIEESTTHTQGKHKHGGDEKQTANENTKDQLSKIEATKKMTSLCQSRRTGREDTHQTTADSLNTNITHFVSTR